MADSRAEEWLTVEEIADELKIATETVRRWIRRREIPFLELGGAKAGYRVKRDDLDAFVQQRYHRAVSKSRAAA